MAKILIIGGGVAGLSAGITAQAAGQSAVLVEQHTSLGGALSGWNRAGCRIDNCIHWLTGTNPATSTYKMWEELGALDQTEIIQGEVLYTSEHRGRYLSLWRNDEKSEREMLARSPKDRMEIRSFWDAVRAVRGIEGTGGAAKNEKSTGFQRILALPNLARYACISTGALAKRFHDPLLRCFFTDLLGEHFSALALVIVAATFCGDNGGIPRGGSVEMAKRMENRFLSLGGEVKTACKAEKILLSGAHATGVRFADGTEESADYVIPTADPKTVFDGGLLDISMPYAWKKRYENPSFARFSCVQSAFLWNGTNPPFCGDFLFDLRAREAEILQKKRLIVREFSHEPSFAPPGKTVLQTMCFLTESEARAWLALANDRPAYNEEKKRLLSAVQTALESKFPSFAGALTPLDLWTPATYRRFTGAEIGSFMGFRLPPRTYFRTLGARIGGIDNVFLATQWQRAPGGLPIAAKAGRDAIFQVLRAEGHRQSARFRERIKSGT